jgi:putative transcriptional regulator
MKLGRKIGGKDEGGETPHADPRESSAPLGKRPLTKSRAARRGQSGRGYLDGQMLIAMPTMGDERFSRSLIYMCAHSSEGAMGIIVNQPAANISFRDLLVQLNVVEDADKIEVPSRVKVLKGGPVDTQRGFVLHSSDFYVENSTLPIDEGVCLTATLDILKAIARGEGPRSALLALGYAGWAPGQLEQEIHQNGWLHCSADPELIFGTDIERKYEKALQKIGIHLGMLSTEAGHA